MALLFGQGQGPAGHGRLQSQSACMEDGSMVAILPILRVKIHQGKESLDSIRKTVTGAKGFDKLVTNLRNGKLRYRNKSLTIIAKLHGISISSISKFLHITPKTALGYWDTYRIFGCQRLFKGFRNKALKSDNEILINTLFSILHMPPSAFNINRTTWKMGDLKRILGEKGHKVSMMVMRTIVRDAGYRWKNLRFACICGLFWESAGDRFIQVRW
jgi:hypothetical protein